MLKQLNRYILLASLLLTTNTVMSQQLPQFTQYMYNQYAFNPAYAGSQDSWEAVSNNRYQWVGITDAPRTFTLGANGPLKKDNLAMGGYVYTDVVGPTRRLGFQTSFSYLIKITNTIKLSFGISLGFNQWILDADKVTAYHPDDFYFSNGLLKSFDPDGKFGLYLFHEDWYVGASIEQIFHDRLSFLSTQVGSESYLEDHYYFMAGYDINVSEKWKIQPSTLLKLGPPAPFKLDMNLRVTYNDMIWAGAGIRIRDAVTVMCGFKYNDMVTVGYGFDFTTTDLKNYNTGTHEVLLGITFGNGKSQQ